MGWADIDFTKVSPRFDVDDLIEEIKCRHPTPVLSRLQMNKRGDEYLGLCPFVPERTPSFTLYRKADGWRAKCFGCGWSGDVVDFVKQYDAVEFKEALFRVEAELAALNDGQEATLMPKEFVFSSLELPYLTARLMADERGRAFLKSRGISEEVARSLQLGLTTKIFSPGGKPQLALCIPRFNDQGKLLGVKYRALDPHDKGSKWLQEPGSAADFLLVPMPAKTDVLFIFEGELDCALALSLGVDAAAYFGTAGVPNGHPSARFLASVAAIKSRGQRVIIVPDADDVGRAAATRLHNYFGAATIAHLPKGVKDLGELWKRDPEAAKRWLTTIAAGGTFDGQSVVGCQQNRIRIHSSRPRLLGTPCQPTGGLGIKPDELLGCGKH